VARQPRQTAENDPHRYALDRHLLPRFGSRKLGAITTDDVARLVAEMRKAGYAGWTITGSLSTLSGCLGRAKRRGLIPANPVPGLERGERPKVGNGPKRVLSEAEITAVLDQATDGFRPLIATMIFAGLRLGETLALRWQDVDFEHGFLNVRHQLTPARELAALKTDSGRRSVVLIPQLGKMLREHLMASIHKRPADFLFPRTGGTRPGPAVNRPRGRTDVEAGQAGRAGDQQPQLPPQLRVATDRRVEARSG